ncbi:MAG: type IV secretion system protein [Sphingomonas sp.]|nr:type IV secretion system protein [Sphingomonas sp.]
MSQCPPFTADGPSGVADALGKVDCLASDATAVSFGRLFGAHGSFQTALTIILTLYVALLAFNLLTGRSALRLSVLTPKMMTLGLVLTFATSWIAYQSVVWNLATGAPDEIASVLVGTKGSATTIFAQQLDAVFNAITDAASSVPAPAPTANGVPPAVAVPTLASPANILSIAGLILLLGTVGVLVVCRLALAALLIIGPVFIVLALFEGTRGLFEGWLKSVAMFAFVPLLTVIMGSGALVAIAPMVAGLGQGGAPIELKAAVSILVASIIYVALMLVVFKVAGTLTKGWRMGRAQALARTQSESLFPAHQERPLNPTPATVAAMGSDRVRSAVTSLETMSSTYRVLTSSPALVAVAAPTQRLALTGPTDARNQLRYLHHRVAGVASTQSREMVR